MFPWWIKYPNVNNEIQNLDWLMYTVKHLSKEVKEFINLNKIKYADPILWDITSQYEANTVVIDPQTGDAYISTTAVPYGVILSNTDYWTKIYNYTQSLNKLEEQIAAINEELSPTATGTRTVGQLVWLNGLLYRITAPMIAGDTYVVNSNCVKTTIEEELQLIVSSFNSIIENIDDDIEDINDDIRDINTIINRKGWGNVLDYGAVGDGVTDDTLAIQNCLDENLCVFFPSGQYLISSALEIRSNSHLKGCNATIIHPSSRGVVGGDYNHVPTDSTFNITIEGLTFDADSSYQTAILLGNVDGVRISNVTTKGQVASGVCTSIAIVDGSSNIIVENCNIYSADYALIFDTTPDFGLAADAINRNISINNCTIHTKYGTCIALNAGNRYVKISNSVLVIDSENGICIKLLGQDVVTYPNQHTENIEIVNVEMGGVLNPTNTQGISFSHGATDISISNCRIADLNHGIYPNYIQAFPVINVSNSIFKNCDCAIEMGGGANLLNARITNNYFGSCLKAISSLFKNAIIQSNTFEKITNDAITMATIHNLIIDSNVFEECHSACVNFTGNGTGSNNNINISNNQMFNCVDAANNTSTIIVGNLLGTVSGNLINSDSSAGYGPLYIIDTTNNRLVVTSNTMRNQVTGYISTTPTIYANNLEF